MESYQPQRPTVSPSTVKVTHTGWRPGLICESTFISPTPSLIEGNIVCAEQYVLVAISLLFRKGNVCASKGFFEEWPSGAGPARLELLGSAGYPDSGRLPTRVPVKASSFKERVWGWGRTNKHMEKYQKLLIMTFRGLFTYSCGLTFGETEVQTNFRQWKKKKSIPESSIQARDTGGAHPA